MSKYICDQCGLISIVAQEGACPRCQSGIITHRVGVAYTIGRVTAYEQAIREGAKKLKGGWVWRTAEEADEYRIHFMNMDIADWKPGDFSVYELELTSWDEDVGEKIISDNSGGAYELKNDVRIVGAVVFKSSDLQRHLKLFTEHLLATVGCEQILKRWLERGIANDEVRKVLIAMYELGKKEAGG